jgi:apolipoprotein N-acyltransferase
MNTLMAALLGALFSAALPGVGWWPLALVLVPLFVLIARSTRVREAFWLGFWFAVAFFGLYLLWLPTSFAALFGPIAWIIYPPLLLILGVFWGLVAALSRWLGRSGTGTLALLPALWLLMEWLRTQGYFAFPWGVLGYLWVGTPVAQLAELLGVYGLSLLTLTLTSLLALPWVRRGQWLAALLGAALLLGAAWGYGLIREGVPLPETTHQVLLVQGDTNPLGRAIGAENDLEIYLRLTRWALADGANPQLVVWPESVVMGPPLESPAAREALQQIQAVVGEIPLVTGVSAVTGTVRFNSVYSLQGGTVLSRYDKVYLVPFGERWPLIEQFPNFFRTVFSWFGLPMMLNTSPGQAVNPLQSPVGMIGAYICYESVFPQVARQMVAQGAQVLLNISNDAWFGLGRGAQQHFLMGSLRAIETRRYLLRAANDGITAVIDPLGRLQAALPRGGQGSLSGHFALLEGHTPYVRLGDRWLLLVVFYALLVPLSRSRLRP